MSDSSGPATQAQFEELHRLVVELLIQRLSRPRCGIEQIAVARAFIRDNQAALVIDPAILKKLQRLHKALPEAIERGLRENPSAGMISEAHAFLKQQGLIDAPSAADKPATGPDLKAPAAQDLPFH
jgi:hypothetical protein